MARPRDFFRQIAARFPRAEPKLTEFPSGALMLDLKIRGIPYCVEYFPQDGMFGLSKVVDATPFDGGVEEAFSSFDALERRLSELLNRGN